MENRNTFSWLKEQMIRSISMSIMIYVITRICISNAYPIFVQQGYEDLGEATERIVCASLSIGKQYSRRLCKGSKTSPEVYKIFPMNLQKQMPH